MNQQDLQLLNEIELLEGTQAKEKTKAGKIIDAVLSIVQLFGGGKILDAIFSRVLILLGKQSLMEKRLDAQLLELKTQMTELRELNIELKKTIETLKK